jgi:hypothetical protein
LHHSANTESTPSLIFVAMPAARRKALKSVSNSQTPDPLSSSDKPPKLRKDGQPHKDHKEHARWLPEDDAALFKACNDVKASGSMGDNGFKAQDWGHIAAQVEAVRNTATGGGVKTVATCKSRLNKARTRLLLVYFQLLSVLS